jgi:hypothetical protein
MRSVWIYGVQASICLNPLHPTDQRFRHPAGPRHGQVESRVLNICQQLCAEIRSRRLTILSVLIKLPLQLGIRRRNRIYSIAGALFMPCAAYSSST